MKRLVLISMIFLLTGISANGQENTLTEFDLYGCWIMERNDDGQQMKKQIYKRYEDADLKLAIKNTKISLLAFNESEFESYSTYVCFITVTEKGTWAYDENEGTISVYWGQEWLKEFKEKDPEAFAKFSSPEKFDKIKLIAVKLDDSKIGLEKLNATQN